MPERAKWREGKLLEVLNQQRRVGEARMGASHDGGEVAAEQSSGRGGATWSAREKARGEELGRRPGRRWHQQNDSSGERRRPVAAEGQLGRAAEQRGVLRESQQEGVEAVGERGGDAWRLGEARGGLGRCGTAASGGAAARQRRQTKKKVGC
jgi:hypothetical protein